MIKISPSLLAADFANLESEVKKIEVTDATMLHLDIMDGHFVPNISIGVPVVASLDKKSDMFLDVHLMISDPAKYAEAFVKAGADLLTFHLEAVENPSGVIDFIRDLGVQVGLSVKPGTPEEQVFPYLDRVDLVLVMTVEPGFGGQSFMPDMLEKISAIRKEADFRGLGVDIEVDGGINAETAKRCVAAGANVLVAGSYIFGAADYGAAVRTLIEAE